MWPWRAEAHARPEAVAGWLGAAGCVLAVYVVVVLGGGLLIGRTSSPHLGLSVLATALVAVLIEPTRTSVERRTRRLVRGHASPYDVLSEFSREVAGPTDAEPMPDRIARVLADGTHAAWAQVWLLVNERLVLVAAHPPAAAAVADPPAMSGADPRPGRRGVAVGHGGVLLGVLRVQERDGRPLTGVELRLLAGLAAQAGLALHTAQLRAELTERHADLARRATELRAARDELATAQYRERRRLERDLHDGAQQELVALGVNLRLAEVLAVRAPERLPPLLGEQAAAARDAIETLSTLARGAVPPALRDGGLAAALTVSATGSPVPVELTVAAVGRFPRSIEAAVYFCCLEALQNAAKHSGGHRVAVLLHVEEDHLRLVVADDGVGLAGAAGGGTGLSNMRERIEGVGGRLTVESMPAGGTTVTASVPAVRVPAQRRPDSPGTG
jgi:signal transduction histidine kinase